MWSGTMRAEKWILLVDDDAGFRDCVVEILEGEGFYVRSAKDGKEALKILADISSNNLPALIFLDARMPNINGQDFLHVLKKEQPNLAASLPFLLCSASKNSYAPEILPPHSLYIQKPVDLEEIVSAVRTLVNSSNPPDQRSAS